MPKVNRKSGPAAENSKNRPVHPYSRKALKLGKQMLHDKRIESSKSNQSIKSELLTEKLQWFQDHLDDRHLYSKQDLIDLTLKYRNRFEEELNQISIVQSVGHRHGQSKQHAAREAAIKITMEDETNQFEGSGIEVPDLINKKHLEEFKAWNGEFRFVQNLKLRKVSYRDIERLNQNGEKHKQSAKKSELVLDNDTDNIINETRPTS